MSPLVDKIKQLLTEFDKRNNSSDLSRDPPAIKALRELSAEDKNNIFKVYQCFVEKLPTEEEPAYLVYKGLMEHISQSRSLDYTAHLLNFLIKENLVTQNIANLVCEFHEYYELSKIFEYLKNSQILKQENFDDILNPRDCVAMFVVLDELTKIPDFGPLSQEMLDLLKLSSNTNLAFIHILIVSLSGAGFINLQNLVRLIQLPEDSFLQSRNAMESVWYRIPRHLLTQAVLDQLMTLSQLENPQQLIQQYVNQLIGFDDQQIIHFNDQQSTHHASVHQSVSDSARRLFNLYSLMIEGNGLQNTLQMIHDYMMQLPENSIKNTAAKKSFERIIHLTFKDPDSNLTIPQLLALSFLAIHDKAKRIGDLSDARAQFVEGLYEIQRGYNLSENGHDQGGPDDFICSGGTFNKLIEKLEGIHSDVKVLYITPAAASLKLPIVVREVALEYLSSLAEPHTLEGFQRFVQLIKQIRQDECVDSIWNRIQTKVADRIFDEFGSLYSGKTDVKLINLIEAGQYLKLEGLSRFQEQIIASPGYKHYCSQTLRYSSNFFLQPSTQEVDSSCSPRFSQAMSRKAGS